MANEAFLFFGIVFLVLLLTAWRNGVFRRGVDTPINDDHTFPQIQPAGRTGESIRDPRAGLPDGDKLGRR